MVDRRHRRDHPAPGPGHSPTVPALWDTYISGPVDQFSAWLRENRQLHPVFTGFFIPVSAAVDWGLRTFESFLLWLPWFVLPMAVFLVIFRTGDWKTALVALAAVLYPGLVGLWDTTMETLSLMTIAVVIALAIGIPMGVWSARSPRVIVSSNRFSTPCRPSRLRSTSYRWSCCSGSDGCRPQSPPSSTPCPRR